MSDIVVRPMEPMVDLPALQRLSPKPAGEFYVRATLVAEIDGEIAGYTQFSLGPDNVLHSLAIRVGAAFKGRGVGQALMDAKVALAKEAGATMHFYAVQRDGEEALKKILLRQGMHLCQDHGDLLVYAGSLRDGHDAA
jgi:GNAT superfamily N-acetyltransferase